MRIGLISIVALIAAIPILTIKISLIGNPITIMFIDVVLPLALVAYFLAGGPYDILMSKFIGEKDQTRGERYEFLLN